MKKYFSHDTRGRTAVVTGASSGIGAAFARRLAAEGFDLVIIARRKELLEALAAEIAADHGVRTRVLATDLAERKGLMRVLGLIGSDATIELLVHSAGFGTRGHLVDVAREKTETMIRLHVFATTALSRAAAAAMKPRGRGWIINVSSIGAFFTTSHYVVYSATKAYINMFSLGLRDELEGTGVGVQALCPGLTDTGFMRTDEYRDFNYGDIPAFAWMSPEEVVEKSLRALNRGVTVVVPGIGNRIFVSLLTAPLLGSLIGGVLSLLGRGKNAY
jgi:short-subunit dehydrogenase